MLTEGTTISNLSAPSYFGPREPAEGESNWVPTKPGVTVVRANVDTLYSTAEVDLGAGPLVLSVTATDRYFVLQMMSLWTDVFAAPGTRTTGSNNAREYVALCREGKFPDPAAPALWRTTCASSPWR